MNAEERRLAESDRRDKHWKRWGPYLSERGWGTVREDYSEYGSAWEYFPHDHARSRAYRWNEDGIGGICNRRQHVCFAVALWNGRDPILKERLFGLTGNEGNHGEDVKELYYYLDSTPTHSYMKFLYKYPQAEFPYLDLVNENRRRGKHDPEYELVDTGIFNDDRYFDVYIEYAKADIEDVLIRITIANRGPEPASINVLPTVWLRNDWTWFGIEPTGQIYKEGDGTLVIDHPKPGTRYLHFDGSPELLFTENETNVERFSGSSTSGSYVKDAFHRYVLNGESAAVNPELRGTKAAANYKLHVPAGGEVVLKMRLTDDRSSVFADLSSSTRTAKAIATAPFNDMFATRIKEADEFYAGLSSPDLTDDGRNVQRQAFAGMLWSKQFYHYVVKEWLDGDPAMPRPPASRLTGRNSKWQHLYNSDVISMPDKWEYPWYAAWDLAFHCVPLALVDAQFAKEQLILMLREWYMHPNGQIPAYEWAFGDVNPPVHAWAAMRVYQIDKKNREKPDRAFLARVFQKLLLN
ncbi:MAG: MGH1-like glycoside hydrolase domain-containing protein, partial [Pyrinomonadaceae bacterium]